MPTKGWDHETLLPNESKRYFFEVQAGQRLKNFSTVLTWNRTFDLPEEATEWGNPEVILPDLALTLYKQESNQEKNILESADVSGGNYEHLYHSLPPGKYSLEVNASRNQILGTPYALAWHSNAVQSPLTYSEWTNASFNPETPAMDTLAGADPDHDGLTNLEEYAFNSDPQSFNSDGSTLKILDYNPQTQILLLAYIRRIERASLTYLLEGSGDLKNWSPFAESNYQVIEQTPSNDALSESVKVRLQGVSHNQFIRLRIQQNLE